MAGNSAPAMPRSGGRAISVLILAVLAGAAMLIALLAMHATSGTLPAVSGDSSRSSDLSSGPAQSVSPVPSAETGMITEAAVVSLPIAAAAARMLAMTAGSTPECARCTPDCALVAMICALLLTVAALIGFGPVLKHQVARKAGVLVRRTVSPPPHIYRPSLTVLSISRT
ncbi:hypothetical protein [Cryobacterium fucosi]|uniref:DUF2946 domain-containing protein n=1 Tax=Cryobacterium fucosi TaxID=1259157 RepID=A0A4R9BDJ0_9MICO|nr:hypothetical protein [Cryobacterium fucosi]TFD81581.1 hypothetical protein E3T48_03235 [Cryobacterium fucosi]